MVNDYLIHHGVKGQRWGVRRYQNEDGTRTEAGKRRQTSFNAKTSRAYSVGSAVGYSMSAVGAVAATLIGIAAPGAAIAVAIANGSAFIGNAIVAGVTVPRVMHYAKTGKDYVDDLIEEQKNGQ